MTTKTVRCPICRSLNNKLVEEHYEDKKPSKNHRASKIRLQNYECQRCKPPTKFQIQR